MYTTTHTQHQHLGSDTQFNVYTGELTAISLTIDITQHQHVKACNIYTNSQPVIKALINPRRQSGQHIIKSTLDKIDTINKVRIKVTIYWVPGHQEIEGNEEADKEAKRAARTPELSTSKSFPYNPLKSARKMAIKNLAKSQQKQAPKGPTPTAKHLRHILKHPKARAGQKYYKAAKTRKTATTLAQLRTGHCQLNSYLYRFKKVASPYCQCRYQPETVQHYMLECRNYKKERDWLQRKIGYHNMRLGIMLGDPKMIHHTAKYIEMTKRMK